MYDGLARLTAFLARRVVKNTMPPTYDDELRELSMHAMFCAYHLKKGTQP